MILNRILTPFGWLVLIALLGVIAGICTGLYSCSQKEEIKEVIAYEFPVAHTIENNLPKKQTQRGLKDKNSRP